MLNGPDRMVRMRPLAIATALTCVAGLGATGPALGQGTDATSEGVRAGWTLHTSDAPAFSIQLPQGWALDPATDGLLGATGPDGETLVVRLDDGATGESLDAFTKASWRSVEKDMEALCPMAGTSPAARRASRRTGRRRAGRSHGSDSLGPRTSARSAMTAM